MSGNFLLIRIGPLIFMLSRTRCLIWNEYELTICSGFIPVILLKQAVVVLDYFVIRINSILIVDALTLCCLTVTIDCTFGLLINILVMLVISSSNCSGWSRSRTQRTLIWVRVVPPMLVMLLFVVLRAMFTTIALWVVTPISVFILVSRWVLATSFSAMATTTLIDKIGNLTFLESPKWQRAKETSPRQ